MALTPCQLAQEMQSDTVVSQPLLRDDSGGSVKSYTFILIC